MDSTGLGVSDKVKVVHKKVDEETGEVTISTNKEDHQDTVVTVPENKRCLECGGPLTPLVILYCKDCDMRYLAKYDPVIGKTIFIPLGKEPKT